MSCSLLSDLPFLKVSNDAMMVDLHACLDAWCRVLRGRSKSHVLESPSKSSVADDRFVLTLVTAERMW